ncbi:MAG: serine/threonine-protein kinase, partial [Rhodoluna sp.]|nr:serine/threonine-protein kinase [Rhodoluna sp.]MBP6186430.1 serine/threonine-protein kinase [Rhodoluna sp.]
MADLVGKTINGRYRVEKLIARGGMATVYIAEDNRLDRKIALKVIHPHLANDKNFREKFVREAKIAAKLSHPNLVNVFDQAEDGDTVFLAMEYVSGITLRQALDDFGSLTANRALDVFEPIIAGLAAAHGAGILHRDIKPENVLLSDDGRIKLSDFGLARPISAQTQTGGVVGTVAYLSPELVSRGTADARSDVYAAGIMLFELLTGKQPYQGEQAVQIAMQHANSEVPPPSSINPSVPALLDEIVLWSTAKLAEHRPSDAIELHKVIIRAKNELLAGKSGSQLTEQLKQTALLRETTVLANPIGSDSNATEVFSNPWHENASDQNATVALNLDQQIESGTSMFASHRVIKTLVASVLVVLLGLGAGWWFSSGPGGFQVMPSLASKTKAEALGTLKVFGDEVEVVTESSKTISNGLVIATEPQS